MAKTKSTHTLWTNPKAEWTRLFEGVQVTDQQVIDAVESAVHNLDPAEVKKRVKPYETPVTNETLSKSVS